MKKKFNLLLISILLSVFAFAQSASKKDIKVFCKSFETEILNNNLTEALSFFDPDYKATQHDDFLAGNTSQFITEFLAGAPKGEALFRTPKIEEVKSIKLRKIQFEGENEATAILSIKLNDGVTISSQVLIIVKSKTKMYFVGAVG